MNVLELNLLVLAYLGDSVYESHVRRYLIDQKIANVNDLQTESLNYVSAKSQARILEYLQENDCFYEDELDIIRRARNTKSTHHPKSCDILTYKHATALEAVVGYLSFLGREERILELMNVILGGTI